MFIKTDNPSADYESYSKELEDALELLPVCSECGKHIQDEHCFVIDDDTVCENCMNKNHRKYTVDLMG